MANRDRCSDRVSFFGFYSVDRPSFDSQLSSLGTFLWNKLRLFQASFAGKRGFGGSVQRTIGFATLISVASGFAVVSHVLDGAAVADVWFGLDCTECVP